MQFHLPLNKVLGNPARVRVLRFFCLKGGEWSGRRVAAELGLNPVTAYRALRDLHRTTILDLRKIGNSSAYSLRDKHHLVRHLFRPLFQREAAVQEQLFHSLRRKLRLKPSSGVVSAALYGSLIRGQERPTSDIDILMLVRSEEAKRELLRTLEGSWRAVSEKFGNSLAPYVNTIQEARQKYRRRLPLFRNILCHHQVFWGKPLEEIFHDSQA